LAKDENFGQKWKFWAKIEIFITNGKLYFQNIKFNENGKFIKKIP